MPKKCLTCNEIYSLTRSECPRCQSRDGLILSTAAARLGGRGLTGYALLGQGVLLTPGPHPEACVPCLALGGLLVAGIEQAVLWTRILAVVMLVGGPLLALSNHTPAPALLALMALFCLWQLNEKRNDGIRAACIALGGYYGVYISIVLVLPHL
jgi:hypothetical protein